VKKATAMSLIVARGTIGLSVVGLLVSLWLVIYTTKELLSYGGAADWPTASGHVLDVEAVTKIFHPTDIGSMFGQGVYKGGARLDSEVVYQYRVKGMDYLGDKVKTIDLTDTSRFLALEKGARILVYYNPANPERSILVPGSLFWPLSTLAIGLLGILIFSWILRRGIDVLRGRRYSLEVSA
jgi:hypothetical protein